MRTSQSMLNLEDLAASQWGMFTSAQATKLGLRGNQLSRLVDSGRVERIGYGVYRYALGGEDRNSDVKAAWLSLYPRETAGERLRKRPYDAVVAGRTAAFMHGAGDFYVSPYTFAMSCRKQSTRDELRLFVRHVSEKDVVFIQGLPVMGVERTVSDLIQSHEDPELVGSFMADASRKLGHVFDRVRLAELLRPLVARNGYKKGDGDSFAAELIARYAADEQIKRGSHAIEKSLPPMHSVEDLRGIQEALRAQQEMAKMLTSSTSVKAFQDSVKETQRQYVSSNIAELSKKMAKTAAEISLPSKKALQGAAAALRSAEVVAALQDDKWRKKLRKWFKSLRKKEPIDTSPAKTRSGRMTDSKFKSARALEMAVKTAARKSEQDTQHAIDDFYHDRFLERVFSTESPSFILKGGRGMLARTVSARHTRDSDFLSRGMGLDDAIEELKRLGTIDLGDYLEYRCVSVEEIAEEEEYRAAIGLCSPLCSVARSG